MAPLRPASPVCHRVCRDPARTLRLLHQRVSPGSSWRTRSLRLCFLAIALTIPGSVGLVFRRMFWMWILSDGFLVIPWGSRACGRKATGVQDPIHHVQGWPQAIRVDRHYEADRLARLLHGVLTVSVPFSPASVGRSHRTQPVPTHEAVRRDPHPLKARGAATII